MKKFLNPKSIAVVGASDKKGKIGNILVKNLKNKKQGLKIHPVNPRHKIIEGLKVSSSILEIKGNIDLAVIAIPAQYVLMAIDECIEKNIKNIVIISAGFAESNQDGKKREKALEKIVYENDLNILGPNCLGFLNVSDGINASFAKNEVPEGGIGLISQSGAFVTGFIDVAKDKEVGFSKIVTLGNKTVLDEVDFLKILGSDPKTKVIGMYLENIKKGREFFNTVNKIAQKKPILVLKAGNSEKVQKAILSHTGSMAGETLVIRKALEEAGALYYEDMVNFWNSLEILSSYKKVQDGKVVILTNAGGPGVVATDLIENSKNISMKDFSVAEKKLLKKNLPLAASVENPIDILGDADTKRYDKTLDGLLKVKGIGFILALITPQAQTNVDGILKSIKAKNKKTKFPIVPILIGEHKKGVFRFPREVIEALDKIVLTAKEISNKTKKEPPEFSVLSSAKVKQFVEKAKEENRNVFFYDESFELMRFYGINTLKAFDVDEKFKLPRKIKRVIMKIDDPKILHKAAQGGVKAGVEGQIELEKSFKGFRKKFKKEKVIIQEQIEKGLEIIVGLKRDPNFGPVLMCGIGGILTEIVDEKLLWILPTTKATIKRDLRASKIGKIFKKENLDIDDLAEEVMKVANIGWQNNWIEELDINPMFFYSNKKDSIAVDVKVKF